MTASKHPKTGQDREEGLGQGVPRPPLDEERNPGIGASKGTFGRGTDPAALNADSTDAGDVMNETDRSGAMNPDHRGRTNR